MVRKSIALFLEYSATQYSTVQYSTVQYSTVQYSTVQYSTVLYSSCTVQQEGTGRATYPALGSVPVPAPFRTALLSPHRAIFLLLLSPAQTVQLLFEIETEWNGMEGVE